MSTQLSARCSHLARMVFGLAGLVAFASVQAQALRITSANALDDAVYDVEFAGAAGSVTTLNTDQNQHNTFRSLAFTLNAATGKIDLLAADTSRGQIVRYAGAQGVSTLVWSRKPGKGPDFPDGLSIDAAGNLFVVSSPADQWKPAELWVLPRDPAQPVGAGFLSPRLLDCGFGGVAVRALKETLVARTASNAAGVGDLLVLASNPAKVFVYSAASIQSVINGSKPVSPTRTLIGSAQFPKGASLESMDFWPADNDLLVATSGGTLLRFSFTATAATREADFASGFGYGEFKLKTGQESGIPYAIVADNAGSRLLQFGEPEDAEAVSQNAQSLQRAQTAGYGHETSHYPPPPPPARNPPLAIITNGVHKPLGLVTTNLNAAVAGACLESAGGCDLLGGLITHDISGLQSSSGYVIEDTCVVQVDPRIAQYGSCTGHSLPVAQVCAGYGNSVIPDTMCGGSGPSGSGFALVRSITNSLDKAKGSLVFNEVFSEEVLPGNNPPCPTSVFAWAPLEGEGTIVEGDKLLELTGTCGSSGGVSRGLSLWGIGLVLNEAALPGKNAADARVKFAASKYAALVSTVALADITPYFRKKLDACICDSQQAFERKKFSTAAAKLVECDALVAKNEASFKASANNANPSGDIRGRFANLYLAVNTRVLGNPPLSAWPPAPPSCEHHSKSALTSTESHKGCHH